MSAKSPLGWLGCLGNLLILGCLGSLVFGGSLAIKLGNYSFGFNSGASPPAGVVPANVEANVEKLVAEATNQYHENFSQGRFDQIYSQAGQQLRNSISSTDFLRICQKQQAAIGTLKSTQLVDVWQPIDEQASGKYVMSRYYTVYSNLAVEESFFWLIVEGKAVLVKSQAIPANSSPQIKPQQTQS